jgi:hypothetical protein
MEKSWILDKHSGSAILVPSWTSLKRSVLVLFVQCPAVSKNTITGMQCCGSGIHVYPLSGIRVFSIPDQNFFHPGSIKEFKYFNPKKMVSRALGNVIRVVHPES